MEDLHTINSYYEHLLTDNSPCQGVENVSIIVNKKRWKKLKKHNAFDHAKQPTIAFRLSRLKKQGLVTSHSSMPELNKCTRLAQSRNKSRHGMDKQNNCKQSPFQSKFIANIVSEHRFDNCFFKPFNFASQTKWKIYRCQLSSAEDSCCCSCNSDAMFEVMKGLYDCYKKKNCDDCYCILCSHLPKDERRLGEIRKSMASVTRENILDGRTPEEKQKILKEMASKGIPLPEGKTASDKALIAKTRKELGLPPAAKTEDEKAKMKKAALAGLLVPLEGKTPAEKEKLLKAQAALGLPLPEGRTPSEKALIAKIGALTPSLKASGLLSPLKGKPPEEKEKILRGLAMRGVPLPEGKTESEKKLIEKVRTDLGLPVEPETKSIRGKHEKAAKAGLLQPLEGKTPEEKEKILKGLHNMGIPLPKGRTTSEKALIAKVAAMPREPSDKTAGLLTPLTGKTPEQKEKILRGLAAKGMPLPEGQTPSEKKLIGKVRADLGLPVEPKSKSIREKHAKAAKAGLLQPLEGKTPAEKEKILKGLHDMGIPLPEGRTASEKALIAKVAASPREPDLLTPLKGKTPEEKEKILRGLAESGLPLPEGQTPSEKKLINKVRHDLGLPIEPKSKSIREKHDKAAKAGILQPLEGKTPAEKERILKGLHNMGIPLPEGRTPSEKALIAKVAASPREPDLLTPLKGKTPEEKEKILRGIAESGLPLPEGQTPSEKKLINKVRHDLGLPIEPKSKSIREKHDKAAKAGILQPLEGKTPAEKERILKGLHNMGIPLPEGRTPSEKALIAKVAASPREPDLLTPLKGKTPEEKEKILRGLAESGLPLPEGETPSEKKLINKVRADLGLPVEPKTKSIRDKHEKAAKAGLLQPLEGKTPAEKEKILRGLHDLGIPLPEGRTPSEKALIAKVAASPREPDLLTPLKGKTPEEKEKILRGLAESGLPLPEGETPSEKKLIDKVRADLGLPTEPKTKSIRDKHEKAAKAGLLQPLEGKTPAEKERILKGLHDMGIPLPEGRTPSEKALIAKVTATPRAPSIKTADLLTPLTGKTPEQKEKILRGLAAKGVPLPEGQTPSEKKLVDKVRAELGLPVEPKSKSIRDKHEKAAKAGLLQPLEGKTPAEKERILKGLHDMGIPLPEGRTPSEKALIAKVVATPRAPSLKTVGLMTPLKGKTPEQKEKILRGLAVKGLPLPEAETPSEQKLIDKVRADLGLPVEPKTKSIRDKHEKAAKAGLLQPLEGKTPAQKEKILKGLHDMGIPLPEGRTASEKALIAKVAAMPRAPSIKTAGLLTPLTGKTPDQKEKILRGLAAKGMPLPEGQTPSEKKLIDKVRHDLGLPIEPKTKSIRDKHAKAAKAGLLQPLEGKTPAEKEKILKGLHDMGIPLPEGRTPSEKALIAKVTATPRAPSIKTADLLTPLTGKTPEQKEKILRGLAAKGMPLPEGQTPSEKKLIDKVRADLGLPIEPKTKSIRDKHDKAAKAGLLQPLEGKTPAEKEKILKGLHDMGIPLPEGRTPSEKALIASISASPRAPSIKTADLLTPLTGKTPEQKEKILRGLALKGMPLPEGQTPSENKLIDKVRADLGLPTEPKTKSIRDKHEKAAKAGLLQPLEGKTPAEKEKILKGLHDMGIPLPEGRTPSEKALIASISASPRVPSIKTAGLVTPLTGKTPEQKEKILKALAAKGLPLPEGQTPSEKKLIDKVRADLGLPVEPKTKSIRDKHEKAAKAGLLQPLEGKTPAEKERILKGLHDMGIPLPEGRTASEKSLIAKVTAMPRAPSLKAVGLMTPIKGKTPEQKEKILRGLALKGLPLPEAETPSEQKLIDKVRADLGLPVEPKTKSIRDKHEKAAKAGLLQPLEGKTPAEKERILKGLHDMGIPLPEGRTPSEKALIASISASPRVPSIKTAGLLTPLTGKTPEQKEKILKGLAAKGMPLPEGQTPSEKKLINKVRHDLGLPIEPKSKSIRDKHEKAAKAGLLQPLEGKTPAEKERILKGLHDMGIPLPEGRTPSEKALIAKVTATPHAPSIKTAGLLTPLRGKTPEQKEKVLRGLAKRGLPLPEGQTPSEKKLINKVRAELGLPVEPKSKSIRDKHEKAAKAGLLQPLEGKTPAEKEKILKGLHDMGIPLPEGRTPSEKALIASIEAAPITPKSKSLPSITSEKMRKAKAAGLFTPLAGKTPEHREKILRGLAETGLPLPEGKTPSEKALIDQIKKELGISEKSPSEKLRKAKAAGLLTPLEGKTPAQKEKILRGRAAAGLPLPIGKSPSERALIQKIKDDTGFVTPSPSERLRKAKAAGLITPLKGKTPSMKEKILRDMKAAGVPIPEGETPSEKSLIRRIITRPPSAKSMEKRSSEKLKAAKAAGLLTPLEGKTPAEKEKILEGLVKAGLPLPEGKTKSEKSMISRIKARIPPEGTTPSEKSIIRKAKAAGLFTPITGKTPEKKEKILRGLAEAGLPLPEGKTASEKSLVKKIRAEAGLPPEPTPSEKKGKIRKKAKKVGVTASKKAAGIDAEEFEDIIKTTTCDRGCGCDKKRIKFKHSYVKIRVTSPDISSLCDCDYECIPGVKAGAFIDNEGIKVTVGSAVGIPSYSTESIKPVISNEIPSNTNISEIQTDYQNNLIDFKNSGCKVDSLDLGLNDIRKENYILNTNSSNMSCSNRLRRSQSENIDVSSDILHCQGRTSESDGIVKSLTGFQSLDYIHKRLALGTKSASSFDTILIIKNDMSVSTSTSNSMDTISLLSFIDSSVTCSSAHYSGYQSTNDLLSINSLDGPSTSDDLISNLVTIEERKIKRNSGAVIPQQYTILGMSQLDFNFGNNKMRQIKEKSESDDPIVLLKHLPSKLDVSKIMFKIMSKKRFSGASSIFIVVPTSDDDAEGSSDNPSNTTIQSSECNSTANTTADMDPDPALRTSSFTGHDVQVCGKGEKFYMEEILSNDTEPMDQDESLEILRRVEMTQDKFSQSSLPNEIAQILEKAVQGVETDITPDRQCSSSLKEPSVTSSIQNSSEDNSDVDIISRLTKPLFLKDKNVSMFRIHRATSSLHRCSDPSSCELRSQQTQTGEDQGPCTCPKEKKKPPKKKSAKIQKPSKESTKQVKSTKQPVKEKQGKSSSWFKRKKSSSSCGGCRANNCVNRGSSPITSADCERSNKEEKIEANCQCPKKEESKPDEVSCDCSKKVKTKPTQETCTCPKKEVKKTKDADCQCPPKESTESRGIDCQCPPEKKETKAVTCKCSSGGDVKVEKKQSAKVQKPSVQSTCKSRSNKKTGKSVSWFRLCLRKKTSSCDSRRPCCNRSCSPKDSPVLCHCPQNPPPEAKSTCGCPAVTACVSDCKLQPTRKPSIKIEKAPAPIKEKPPPKQEVAKPPKPKPVKRKPSETSLVCYDQGSSPMTVLIHECPSKNAKAGKKSSGISKKFKSAHKVCICPSKSNDDIKTPSPILKKPSPKKKEPKKKEPKIKEPKKKEPKKKEPKKKEPKNPAKPKKEKKISCGTSPCCHFSISSLPSYNSCRDLCNQQNQTSGEGFIWHRSPSKRKASAGSLLRDESLESLWPRELPLDDDVDDKKITKTRSAKVQKPSIQSARNKGRSTRTKTGSSWFRRLKASAASSNLMVFDTLPCYDISSSQMQSHDSHYQHRNSQYPTMRNASVKVQKPSIESMGIEGRSTPIKAVVNSSRSYEPCCERSSSIMITIRSFGTSPCEYSYCTTSCNDQSAHCCIPCSSHGSLPELLNRQSVKVQKPSIESVPKPDITEPPIEDTQKVVSTGTNPACPEGKQKKENVICGCKEVIPITPKASKKKKVEVICECPEPKPETKEDPCKELTPTKKIEEKKVEVTCKCKESKPETKEDPCKELTPKKKVEIACKCKESKPENKEDPCKELTPKKKVEIACKCKESNPENKEDPCKELTPKKKVEIACKCKDSKPETCINEVPLQKREETKSQGIVTDLRGTEIQNLQKKTEELATKIPIIETGVCCQKNKGEKCCDCKQDKSALARQPKDLTSHKLKETVKNPVIHSEPVDSAPSTPIDSNSAEGLVSRGICKEPGKDKCKCKLGSPTCLKVLQSPIDLNSSDNSLNIQEQRAPSDHKDSKSVKDLASPETSKKPVETVTAQDISDTCECSKLIPNTVAQSKQSPPIQVKLHHEEPPAKYVYAKVETGTKTKLKSKLTTSTSGINIRKRKKIKKPVEQVTVDHYEHETQLNFGEAIRYFADMNPELFRKLMQEEVERQLKAEEERFKGKEGKKLKKQLQKEKKEREKAQKKAEKEARKIKIDRGTSTAEDQKGISTDENKQATLKDEDKKDNVSLVPIKPPDDDEGMESPEVQENNYPRGFKFSKFVKGGAIPMSGVDCYVMT